MEKLDFISVKQQQETKSDTNLGGQGSGVNLGEDGGGVNMIKTHWMKFSKNYFLKKGLQIGTESSHKSKYQWPRNIFLKKLSTQ